MKTILKEIGIALITAILIAIPFYYDKFHETSYHWLFAIAFYVDVVIVHRLIKFYFEHKDD